MPREESGRRVDFESSWDEEDDGCSSNPPLNVCLPPLSEEILAWELLLGNFVASRFFITSPPKNGVRGERTVSAYRERACT